MYRTKINWGLILFLLILISCTVVFFLIDFRLKASILEIARSKAQISGVETINRVVNNKIVSKIEYKDIVYIHKDNNGRVVLIQPNTLKLNQIMATTTEEVTASLGKMSEQTFSIPLGQLTGIRIFAGYGPRIEVKTIPTGQVRVDVLDKFDQAGINQTRHLIFLKVISDIKVAVPFMDKPVKVLATIPLAETIIVGNVPDTYVNIKGANDLLESMMKGGT
ncbi:MAG: sporulation protein YunB [Syntrophomonadaceae bacterium]|jgi:sporulation protein YunB